MADISITAASVAYVSGPRETRNAAVAITAGQVVYAASSSTAGLSQTDGTAAEAAAIGIALNNAGSGQPVTIATDGAVVTLTGATTVANTLYYVSNAAGGICLIADIGAADYVTSIGYATGTGGQFVVKVVATGGVLA
jgi:hypothetical protein